MGGYPTGPGGQAKPRANRRVDWLPARQSIVRKALLFGALFMLFVPLQATAATRDSLFAQPRVSASQAAAIVRGRHGGRVLSVVPSSRGEQQGYRVRILIGGERVKTVFVADQNGAENRSRRDSPRRDNSRNRD